VAEDRLQDALNELRKHNIRLKEIAERDELTGVCNRRGFASLANEIVEESIAKSTSSGGSGVMNSSYSHPTSMPSLRRK
jgi:GGDEF domain-containing protein